MPTLAPTPEPPLTKIASREWALRCEMTTERVALGAARLMLQQHLLGHRPSAVDRSTHMSVFESLCLAAGGHYGEDGELAPPDEPEAATLLTRTCQLLANNLTGRPMPNGQESFEALQRLRNTGAEEHIVIQHLLATAHTVDSLSRVRPDFG